MRKGETVCLCNLLTSVKIFEVNNFVTHKCFQKLTKSTTNLTKCVFSPLPSFNDEKQGTIITINGSINLDKNDQFHDQEESKLNSIIIIESGGYTHIDDKIIKKANQWYNVVTRQGPSLATSLEPLALRRNVASLSLLYRYYFGRCSSGLAQLVPLPFSRGRSTRYSDRLHDFSVTIPRCYKDVYVSSFFPRTARLWFSLPIECVLLTNNLNAFKSN